jgi:hypothetical protein
MYQLVVNGNHPVMSKVLKMKSARQQETVKQLVDLAMLSQGLLKGEALTTSTVYTKQQVDQQLATKQATLSSSTALSVASLTAQTLVTTPSIRAPTTLNIYTNALSSPTMSLSSSLIETIYLLIASGGFRVVTGWSSGKKKDVANNLLKHYQYIYNGNLASSGTVIANKLTSRYIETPSGIIAKDMQLKADNVQFIGLDNICFGMLQNINLNPLYLKSSPLLKKATSLMKMPISKHSITSAVLDLGNKWMLEPHYKMIVFICIIF